MSELVSENSRSRLTTKIRRVGLSFGLLILLLLAAVHWIIQEVRAVTAPGLTAAEMAAVVEGALFRVDVVLVLAGIALAPILAAASVLVGRFIRAHFEELEQANRYKTQFVSMVSHEMQTPLNAMNGFANLLNSGALGPLTEEQKGYVREIRTGAHHMSALINDLLDVARIEAGKIELAMEEFQLTEVIRDVLAIAGPAAKDRGVALRHAGTPATTVSGDRKRIGQVLLNLLSNAIKFTNPGGTVEISVTQGVRRVRLTVRDEGPGIAPEEQASLFQEFYQTRAGRLVPQSSGLGLAICRKLAEMHQGRIWLESELGRGSKFHFDLPAPQVEPRKTFEPGAVAWVPGAAN